MGEEKSLIDARHCSPGFQKHVDTGEGRGYPHMMSCEGRAPIVR